MKLASLILATVIIATCSPDLHAQWYGSNIPDSLSFQGYLTNDSGVPVDAPTDMTFKLYKGSNEVWSQTQSGVPVSNGVFHVILGGSGGASLESVAFNGPIELGMTVGGNELMPRTPLAAAPYALGIRGFYAVDATDGIGGFAPNLIGGGSNNYVADGVIGAVIAGGGGTFQGFVEADSVLGQWGVVGGGQNNVAGADFAVVSGGTRNKAYGFKSNIAGGHLNQAKSNFSNIGGGIDNETTGFGAVIGGGSRNVASGDSATVGGGRSNSATGIASVIAGGASNEASGDSSSVGGGSRNIASQQSSVVAGGGSNHASGYYSAIGGGQSNEATATYGVVAGGQRNTAGNLSAVGGGFFNDASGAGATIPGGRENAARGDYAFAAGFNAKANYEGSFVWADRSVTGSNDTLGTTGANQFLIRAAGGVGIGTNNPANQFHVVRSVSASASVQNHVAVIDNTSTGTGADVLALRVGTSGNPQTTNAFISFKYNGNNSAGFIRGNGNGGIEVISSAADFAEFLPKLEAGETLRAGDVVGVFAGHVSKRTEHADQVMVVSTAPIVVGNDQRLDGEDDLSSVKIAFIGQVPVRVRGAVEAGDFLIPSGLNDGAALALKPEAVRSDQLRHIFATSWESSSNPGESLVNAAVGVDQAAAAGRVIDALRASDNDLANIIRELQQRVAQLERAVLN